MAKHLIMGTAGHVDHGKTALIRALTGIECDTHKEEKERGITINLGFAHLELSEELSLGIVDVPGHKDFVKTMVAGAYGIDFVLLVIAADSGIMPQTKEHFNIIRMLGIKHGLVALNKSDLVDDEMIELAKLEIMEFLEDSPMEHAPIVAVSSITGEGIDTLKTEIKKIARSIPEKSHAAVFRMYIDRIFNIRGIGIVVTGSVLGGEIRIGQDLFLLPGNHDRLKIKSIERHGKQVESVSAGDRAAINLSGLKYDDFERGMLLTGIQLSEINRLDALVELFQGNTRLGIWSQQIFHTGTFSSKARMHLLNSDELTGGAQAIVQIQLEKPAILLNNDRFILRNSSNDLTIGGGLIIDNRPLHHKRRTGKLRQNLEVLAKAVSDRENLSALILLEMDKAMKPLSVEQIANLLGKQPAEIVSAIEDPEINPQVYLFENQNYLVSDAFSSKAEATIFLALQNYHSQNPLKETGLETKELAGKVRLTGGFDYFLLENCLAAMLAEKKLKKVGGTFVLKEHQVKFDRKMQDQITWLEEMIQRSGMQRATINEVDAVAQSQNIRKGQLVMYLQYLAANGKIYYNGEDVLHTSLVNGIRLTLLRKLAESPRGINEKDFRLLIDGTKKAIQALINLFIQEGIIEKETFYLHITDKGKSLI